LLEAGFQQWAGGIRDLRGRQEGDVVQRQAVLRDRVIERH
jgi:hypothetical protein